MNIYVFHFIAIKCTTDGNIIKHSIYFSLKNSFMPSCVDPMGTETALASREPETPKSQWSHGIEKGKNYFNYSFTCFAMKPLYQYHKAWHSVTGKWWTVSSAWKPQLDNNFSVGMMSLSLSYLGQPNVSRLRQGMFSFINRSFSTWPPLYATTVLFSWLCTSSMSLINFSNTLGFWKCSALGVDRLIRVSFVSQSSPFVCLWRSRSCMVQGWRKHGGHVLRSKCNKPILWHETSCLGRNLLDPKWSRDHPVTTPWLTMTGC